MYRLMSRDEYHASFGVNFLSSLDNQALQDLFVITTRIKVRWNARAHAEYFAGLFGAFRCNPSLRWIHVSSMKTSNLWHQVESEVRRRDLRWDPEVHALIANLQ